MGASERNGWRRPDIYRGAESNFQGWGEWRVTGELSIPIKNFPPVVASSSTLCIARSTCTLGGTYIHFTLYTLQPSSDRFSLRNLVAFARLGWGGVVS